MSGKGSKYAAPEISVRAMFHSRRRHLTSEAWSELSGVLRTSPRLAAAYQFEQRILSVHEKRHLCAEEARKRVLKAWVALPKEIHSHFSKFRTAITERSVEYFNNWAKGAIDNGVTEAKNRGIRDILRAGRGLKLRTPLTEFKSNELRRRAIYTMSPSQRIARSKLGLPGPIEQARIVGKNAEVPSHPRTVSRHGMHKPGPRQKKSLAKQMKLFPETR